MISKLDDWILNMHKNNLKVLGYRICAILKVVAKFCVLLSYLGAFTYQFLFSLNNFFTFTKNCN